MYEFAEDVGGLDRSHYFGYPKDLYHFDHFMGALQHPERWLLLKLTMLLKEVSRGHEYSGALSSGGIDDEARTSWK